MTIAAKHFDPQLGIDIHLYEIPPSPVPIPLPTPHIGLVFDPFDYIPFIGGTVHVNGIKRATAGTGGLDVHIPVGGMWVPPMEVAEGPQPDDQLFMGSKTVVADGAPFSKLCMPVLDCNMVGMIPPLRLRKPKKPTLSLTLPTAVNLAIPTNVSVGGPPTIDMLGLLFQAGFAGALKGLKALKKLKRFESAMEKFKAWHRAKFKDMPSGFLKCKVLRAEPVDIRDGSVVVEHEDFAIPGRLPLAWTRIYHSREHHDGLCGHGWHTPADLRLELDTDGVAVFVDSERHVVFPQLPAADGFDHAVLELVDGSRLYAEGDEYRVRTKGGLIHAFHRRGGNVVPLGSQVLPIERIEDRCGNHWRFERTDGRLTRIQESGIDGLQGRFIDVVMQAGRLHQLQLHDPATGINHPLVGYDHDKAGDLVAAIDPLGAPRTFEYAEHHLVRHTDRTGLSFYYEYDARHQVIHAWGDGGLYDYRFRYDAELQETEVTDSLGHVSLVKFDADGLPLCEIDPLDGVTVFEYDEVGRTTAVVDPMGLRTEFEYDVRGNLLVLTRPDGSTVQSAYDEDDQPVAVTDPSGAQWQQQWNAQGLLAGQTTPLGAASHYAYDAHGQLTEHVNALGAATRLAFDRHGALAALTDALGHVDRFEHDPLGRLLSRTDAIGRSSRYRYDAKGRLLEIISPGDARVHCEYDAEDQLVRYRDEAGHVTELTYTGIGQLACRKQPDGHRVRYEYDTEEQLVAVVNQRGERYELKRDALGRIVEEIDYWGQGRRYDYDAAGRLCRSTDPLGHITRYATDKLGRIAQKTFPDPDRPTQLFTETFTYDSRGQLIELCNPHSHVKRRFDAEGRLAEEVQNGFRIANTFDAISNRILRETSAGNRIACTFDPRGQVASVAINDEAPITIGRDVLGRALNERLSSQVRRQFSYNERDLLTAQAVLRDEAPLFETRYDYDRVGNLTARRDDMHGVDTYVYDPVGRLLSHTDPEGTVQHLLNDPAGDRLRTQVCETRMEQIVGGKNLPDQWTREGHYEGLHYVFDRAGNLVRRGEPRSNTRPEDAARDLHLRWDANYRLVESRKDGKATRYGYDPLGRRVFKRNPTHTTWFYWDGDTLLGEVTHANDAIDAPPTSDGNVLDFIAARKRKQAFEALHPRTREYAYYPDTFMPLALIDPQHVEATGNAAASRDDDGGFEGEREDLPPAHTERHEGAVPSTPHDQASATAALRPLATQRTSPESPPSFGGLGQIALGQPSTGHNAPAPQAQDPVPTFSSPSLAPHGQGPAAKVTLSSTTISPGTDGAPFAANPATNKVVSSTTATGQTIEATPHRGNPQSPVAPLKRSATVHHYHVDPNGCPTRLTDADGKVAWSVNYAAWGGTTKTHTTEITQPLRFQGQYFDTETGLHYNRHRYYDPVAGQFVGQDPIGLDSGIENVYEYAFNANDFVDPLGLWNRRRKNGQYAAKPGPKPKPSLHGNSKASTKPASLYAMYDQDGDFQKWGITQETSNLRNRYGNSIPKDWDIVEMTRGKRSDMLKLERELASKMPGPRNFEPHAGKLAGQALSDEAENIAKKAGCLG